MKYYTLRTVSIIILIVLFQSINVKADNEYHIKSEVVSTLGPKLGRMLDNRMEIRQSYMFYSKMSFGESKEAVRSLYNKNTDAVEHFLKYLRAWGGTRIAMNTLQDYISLTTQEYDEVNDYYVYLKTKERLDKIIAEKKLLDEWTIKGFPDSISPTIEPELIFYNDSDAFAYAYKMPRKNEFNIKIDFQIDSLGRYTYSLNDSSGITMDIDSFMNYFDILSEPLYYEFPTIEGQYRFNSMLTMSFNGFYTYDELWRVHLKYNKRKQIYMIDTRRSDTNIDYQQFLERNGIGMEEYINECVLPITNEKELYVTIAIRNQAFKINTCANKKIKKSREQLEAEYQEAREMQKKGQYYNIDGLCSFDYDVFKIEGVKNDKIYIISVIGESKQHKYTYMVGGDGEIMEINEYKNSYTE